MPRPSFCSGHSQVAFNTLKLVLLVPHMWCGPMNLVSRIVIDDCVVPGKKLVANLSPSNMDRALRSAQEFEQRVEGLVGHVLDEDLGLEGLTHAAGKPATRPKRGSSNSLASESWALARAGNSLRRASAEYLEASTKQVSHFPGLPNLPPWRWRRKNKSRSPTVQDHMSRSPCRRHFQTNFRPSYCHCIMGYLRSSCTSHPC